MRGLTVIGWSVARAVSPCLLLILIPLALGSTVAAATDRKQEMPPESGRHSLTGGQRGASGQESSPMADQAPRLGTGVAEGSRLGAGQGPEGKPRPPKTLWQRMRKVERVRVEDFIEEHFPRMFLELRRVEEKHRERFERRMSRIAPQMQHLIEIMEVHPQRGALMIKERQLEVRIAQLVRRHRSVKDESKRPALRKKIRRHCAEAFDCRHERRALEISELEARIAELKARHIQASQMRGQLIKQEVKKRLDRPVVRQPKKD